MKIKLLFLILSFSINTFALVESRTETGEKIKWPIGTNSLIFHLNSTNASGLSSTDIRTLLQSSLNEWNNASSSITSAVDANEGTPATRNNVNDIYFSNESYFGSGVLAITQTSYYDNGEIVESDILINDNVRFTTTNTDSGADVNEDLDPSNNRFYLGDVLTHELGHAVGIGHSQVHRSTMFYSIFPGQATLEDEGKHSIRQIYPPAGYGSIRGKVIGSQSIIGVMGASVQAISVNTGKVMASAVTREDGFFSMSGLPFDDSYYIYTGPSKVPGSTLPKYFHTRKTNFCLSGNDYRGAFFTGCSANRKGKPQAITLNSSNRNYDLGYISIKCSFEVPTDYVQPPNGNYTIDVDRGNSVYREAVTGYFLNSQVTTNNAGGTEKDTYQVDLSGITLDDTKSYFLEIRPLTLGLYSNIRVDITAPGFTLSVTPSNGIDASNANTYDFDRSFKIDLDETDETQNNITFEVSPQSAANNIAGVDYKDLFPDASNFLDPLNIYFLSLKIVEDTGGGSFTTVFNSNVTPTEEESSCPDGPNTYAVLSNATTEANLNATEEKVKSDDDALVSCATVDLNNPPGPSNGAGFMIGLILTLLLASLRRKKETF